MCEWRRVEVATARPIESVVLPNELKAQAVDDLEEFVSPGTREWYIEHFGRYRIGNTLDAAIGHGALNDDEPHRAEEGEQLHRGAVHLDQQQHHLHPRHRPQPKSLA